jgi:hypothetical protein
MNPQYTHYSKFAAEFAANHYHCPNRKLTDGERHVIAIYELLKDGDWHTSKEIMLATGSKSKQHTCCFMRSLKNPLGLASGQQGYCIVTKHTVLIA